MEAIRQYCGIQQPRWPTFERLTINFGLKKRSPCKPRVSSSDTLQLTNRRGFLSLEPFRLIVNDTRFHSIPMILETPAPEQEIWAEEIKMLYWMIGKKADDPELLEREKVLQEKGREDREKQLDVLRRKAEKATKTPRKRKTQGGKNGVVSESSNESDSDSDSQM